MPWTPPRRAISTATTITVNSNALPAWLPAPGYWSEPYGSAGSVSLNRADDSSVKGNFPPAFLSSRSFGAGTLWDNYSGGVWNPYIGTYGAYLFHGGGHSATTSYSPMLDNAVYMWRADTRQWSRLTDPMYPGTVPPFSPYDWGWSVPRTQDDLTEADEPLKTYGELQTNVPCSNHTRYNLCILPQSLGGSSQGSMVLARIAAAHITGAGRSEWGHILDCSSALSLGSASGYQAWLRLAGGPNPNLTGGSACIDTAAGCMYQVGSSSYPIITRYNFATQVYSTATPSNWTSGGFFGSHNSSQAHIIYAPERNGFVWLNNSYAIAVAPTGSSSSAIPNVSSPTINGTANRPASVTVEQFGGVWCKDLGAFGAIVCWDYRTKLVHACYCDTSSVTGSWTWAVLNANNTPSNGNAIWWYNRFQYAPALKSFFLCSMPTDTYGGMVCFRPSEIP